MDDDDEVSKELENLNDDKQKIFNYVVEFVEDLYPLHDKNKPLTLYRKLLVSTKNSNDNKIKKNGINKVVSGFKNFLLYHRQNILSNTLERIPRGEVIKINNSETIYIDIQRFIYKSDEETKCAIRRHLLIIASVLDPEAKQTLFSETGLSSKEKVDLVLSTVNDGSAEGDLIANMVNDVSNSMKDSDSSNPAGAIMQLFSNGTFSKLQSEMESGKIDPNKLLSQLQSSMNKIK
jgi:hypothetical protein